MSTKHETQWKRGNELRPEVQAEAKRRFIYRWTSDNEQREQAYCGIGKPTLPLVTDVEWLADTDFAVRADGRLDERVKHCWTHNDVPAQRKVLDEWKAKRDALNAPFKSTAPAH